MGSFKFDGKSSEDFGLFIQTPPTYNYPERDLIITHIPGRNGDVIQDNKCFKNTERAYLVGKKFNKNTSQYDNFQSVLNWLNSTEGKYVRLEDSYDSDIYRLASFQSGGNIVNHLDKAGAATITFVCKPQRFLLSGEKELSYIGSQIFIENSYSYIALPLVRINEIKTTLDTVLMMTILDKNGIATSSVTFSNYIGEIIIDSENQVVYDDNNNDLSDKIGLNGKQFPSFSEGINSIVFNKYTIESSIFEAYSSLLAKKQKVCISEYKTYTALETTKQKKYFIKSYDNLIVSKKEDYFADSVQGYFDKIAETYTFDSFNTVLNNYSDQYMFTGSAENNISTKPDWINLEDTDNGKTITATAAIAGFFLLDGTGEKIKYISKDSIISNKLNPGSLTTIKYYKSKEDTEEPELQAEYSDIPEWLTYTIEYENSPSRCPIKVHFKVKKNIKGYYWTDKKNFLDKAKWMYYNPLEDIILSTLTWNTSKKAFGSPSLTGVSTTSTFTYKYVKYSNEESPYLPKYETIVVKTTNDRGEIEEEILNEVHFNVQDATSEGTLSKVNILAKEEGYYSYKTDKMSDPSEWSERKNQNETIIGNLSGTVSFEIYYLESIPNYAKEPDFPIQWLNPDPDKTGNNPLNPTSIKFRVYETSFYRVSAKAEDDTPQKEEWREIIVNKPEDGSEVPFIGVPIENMNKKKNDSYYIYKISSIPELFNKDRSFYDGIPEHTMTETPPNWLGVTFSEEENELGTPIRITYKVNEPGYYKWDSNSSWRYYRTEDINTILFETGGKDDSIIYFLENLPIYSVEEMKELNGKIQITPVINSLGNPIEVMYKVLETGYYKINNNSDWIYFLEQDNLIKSKVGESNVIYHLEEIPDSEENNLNSLELKIKPRWWIL